MDRKPAPKAGSSAPVAGGAHATNVIGVRNGQPSLGFIGGLGVGLALLLIVALIDRARRR